MSKQFILDAVNNYLAGSQGGRQLKRRHINEAVCIARRRLLVSNDTLRAAGYNEIPVRRQLRTEPWGGRSSYHPKKVRRR